MTAIVIGIFHISNGIFKYFSDTCIMPIKRQSKLSGQRYYPLNTERELKVLCNPYECLPEVIGPKMVLTHGVLKLRIENTALRAISGCEHSRKSQSDYD